MRRAQFVVAPLLLLAACTPSPAPRDAATGPVQLRFGDPLQTLALAGRIEGALPGLGPEVGIEAWLRADGRARIEVRSEDGEEGPRHEILLWDAATCLLFDARGGRFVDLGPGDGRLEALGNLFQLRDAVFLACGRDPVYRHDEPTELLGVGERFRGVRESGRLRREGDEAGLRWLDGEDSTHELTVVYKDYLETGWGPWPRRAQISGTDLKTAARLHWDRVGPIVVMGDSIFDPFWEPGSR